ncbi:FAD-dependent oxidoreductase, partial [Methylobacterium sp. W2]|uniref:FAD-dependent oxidoreductase n=1 Tax=Methylobacterium sp. W2 TaxID=2598107 RepID=UPI001D0C8975
MANPTAFLWSLSSSTCVAAIRLAEMGMDVVACGAYDKIGEMAGTGLSQTDREIGGTSFWGYQNEFYLRAGDLCGYNDNPNNARRVQIFPSPQAADTIFREWLNKYPERTVVSGQQKGKIIWRTNAELTGVKMNGNVLEQVTAGGTTYDVWDSFDGSDENDLVKAMGLPLRLGRESAFITGEKAGGVTPIQLQSGTRAYDFATGNRLPWLKPRPRRSARGEGDSSVMA